MSEPPPDSEHPTDAPADARAEQALRDALTVRADRLQPVAITPPGRRSTRPRWVAVVAAAALVAAAGALVAFLPDGEKPGPTAADNASSAPGRVDPALGRTRTVSFRDVAVQVPVTWPDDDAPTDQWCINKGFPRAPYVARESSMRGSTDVGCFGEEVDAIPEGFPPVPERLWAAHLSVYPAEQTPGPDGERTYRGWTLTARTVGSVQVELLTDAATTTLAEPILDTAVIRDVDDSGCETTSPAQGSEFVRPPAFDVAGVQDVSAIAVCHYVRGATDVPGLLGSRVLTGVDARQELAAIQAAPEGGGPDHPENCIDDYFGDTALVLRLLEGDQALGDVYVYYDWCFGNGFDDGTTRRAITEDACAPLWGGPVVQYSGDSSTFGLCHPDR